MTDIILVPGTPSDSEEDELKTSTPLMTRKNAKFDKLDVSHIPATGNNPSQERKYADADASTLESSSESEVFSSFAQPRKPAHIIPDSSSSDEGSLETIAGTPSTTTEDSSKNKLSAKKSKSKPTPLASSRSGSSYQLANTEIIETSKQSIGISSDQSGKIMENSTPRESSAEAVIDIHDSTVIDELADQCRNIDLAPKKHSLKKGPVVRDAIEDLTDSLQQVNIDKHARNARVSSPSSSPEILEIVPKTNRIPTHPQVPQPQHAAAAKKDYGFKPQRKMIFLDDLPETQPAAAVPEHLKGSVDKLLTRLQKIITAIPKDDGHDELGQPDLLKTELYNHQRYGLKWLWWREAEKPYGGILADEMGLGKTVMILALICRSKCENKENKSGGPTHWHSKEHERLVPSRATLVVCPPSVLGQWEDEIKKRSSGIRVLVYHGASRPKSAAVLAQYDVVLTTYSTLGSEIPKLSEQTAEACRSPAIRVGWLRIVLDEGHIIRNPKTTGAQAVCRLSAHHRWVVTGTPVHNKPSDMFSLVKFLRLSPFDDPQVWESWIGMKTVGKQQAERLCTVTKCLLIRRTKDEVMNDAVKGDFKMQSIPPKTVVNVTVELKPEELEVYEHLDSFATKEFRLFLKEKEKRQTELQRAADQFMAGRPRPPKSGEERSFTHIFTLILRLRQCAVLPHLIQGMIEDEEDVDDSIDFEDMDEIITKKNPVFSENYKSAKLEKMLEDIDDLKQQCRSRGERMEKIVIVSQWVSLLKIVDMHLRAKGYSTTTISGEVKICDRTDIMMKFNADPKRPQIMLLSLTAGGVGLNLTGANHLFFLDIHWNPQLELQAQDRIHRFGQKRPVTIRRYISAGTIENRIVELQEQKLELADGILNKAQKKNGTGLNIAEMRQLFGV